MYPGLGSSESIQGDSAYRLHLVDVQVVMVCTNCNVSTLPVPEAPDGNLAFFGKAVESNSYSQYCLQLQKLPETCIRPESRFSKPD
jgi:hypothetical protein